MESKLPVPELMRKSLLFALLVVAVCLASATSLHAQRGAITLPRNLEQLVAQAATIVRGHVIGARVETHPALRHLYTVVVTLRVQETLKGTAGESFTFRQFIWDIRDRYDAAGYRRGQELLLLMNAPTRYGLASPAGLQQGRFRVLRDSEGRAVAVNGHGNAGLFRGLEPALMQKGIALPPGLTTMVQGQRAEALPLDDLTALIRQLARSN